MSRLSFERVLKARQGLRETKGLGTSRKTDVDRWIRTPEVLSLLAAAKSGHETWGPAAYDALLFAANLGLRASEVVDLALTDFANLASHNAILVRSAKSRRKLPLKARDILALDPAGLARLRAQLASTEGVPRPKKIDTVYVGDKERELLLSAVARRRTLANRDPYGRMFPFSKRYFQLLFNYYARCAGLRAGLSPHCLRRFVATRLTESTGDTRLAARRLRHHEKNVTMGYVDFPPERQLALLNKVEPVY